MEKNDLSIMVDAENKLNVRVTGVFIKDGKVLLDDCKGIHYALPGGRVKIEEDSLEAFQREMKEELHETLKDITLNGVLENFYTLEGTKVHEYMWMYRADFVDDKLFQSEEIVTQEGDKQNHFEWIKLEELDKIDFRPSAAIPYIRNMDQGLKHIINHQNR